MSAATAGAAAAASAAASASGLVHGYLVVVEKDVFLRLLSLEEKPLIVEVHEKRGLLKRRDVYIYVAGIKGLVFATKSQEKIHYPGAIKVAAERLIAPPAARSLL